MRKVKKLTAVLLALFILAAFVPVMPVSQAATSGVWKYTVKGGNAIITGYTGSDNKITIPSKLDGIPVTEIRKVSGIFAFITSVTIPNSVTSIGEEAFFLTGLKSLTIPNSVTGIGEEAFLGCSDLKSVSFGSGLKTIGVNAFSDCDALKTITVHKNNKYLSVKGGALYNKAQTALIRYAPTKSGKYTVPNTVKTIRAAAFDGCAELTGFEAAASHKYFSTKDGVLFDKKKETLIAFPPKKSGKYAIPNTVKTIGKYAFNDCRLLTGVTIPKSVTTIEEVAFRNCYDMDKVTVPKSVTTIGEGAFWDEYMSIDASGGGPGTTIVCYFNSAAYKYAKEDSCPLELLDAYTVVFEANGSEEWMSDQYIANGKSTALSANKFTRKGYTFAGWATKKNGKVVYKNKQKVNDIAKKGKTITLYAVWVKK